MLKTRGEDPILWLEGGKNNTCVMITFVGINDLTPNYNSSREV